MPVTGDSDDFGDRMKAYECAETGRAFDANLPVYARIDGRSFSNFTRSMRRPFDARMTAAMVATTKRLVKETHARIGYTQSDEISLVWTCDNEDSEPLFGNKVHKLTSVLASLAAASFQYEIRQVFEEPDASILAACLPHFDARVFSLPTRSEAANVFLWRAMDARKNAVSMATRSVYSAKQMFGADQTRMRAMLADKGIDFESYPPSFKWGTWVRRVTFQRAFTPDELMRIPEKHRPAADTLITRSEVREIDMPEFHRVRNRIAVVLDGAAPECSP